MTNADKKFAALTFDDGPNRGVTPQILEILKHYQTPGTFFVCGANIVRHNDIIKQIAAAGQIVGNHTYSHSFINRLLGMGFSEVIKTQQLIELAIGPAPKLLRLPWGKAPIWYDNAAKKAGYTLVPYNSIGRDWETRITAEKIIANIMTAIPNRAIILLHDGHNIDEDVNREATVQALPKLIERLHQQSYELLTIPEYFAKTL